MNFFLRLATSIPLLPIGDRSARGVRTSRRRPGSRWISPLDIYLNILDRYDRFAHRTPAESMILRDRDDRYQGVAYRERNTRDSRSDD